MCCSQWLGSEAVKSALLQGQRVEVVPNPIDIRIYRPGDKRSARQQLGLPETGRMILFVSQRVTNPNKGMQYLIEACRMLAGDYPERHVDTFVAILGGHAEEIASELAFPTYSLGYVNDEQRIVCTYQAADVTADPDIAQGIAVDRRQGELVASFVPLVYRDGHYQKLVSFMLQVTAKPKEKTVVRRASAIESRYADHSVFRIGRWVKISIPQTGIYQLTDEVAKQAGFTSASKVRIYGYGGALQPEQLTADYLQETDDLQEVPTCTVNGRRLFYGIGPVTWDSNHHRVRNPYSSYGYYFLTEDEEEPYTIDEKTFKSQTYPLADDYNTLYEVDNYAWYHGGRNLYDATELKAGGSKTFTLESTGTTGEGSLTVALSGAGASTVLVSINDIEVGTMAIPSNGTYERMRTAERTFSGLDCRTSLNDQFCGLPVYQQCTDSHCGF